ncbi:MAG: uracil-DNA glycosylase [Planctomycetota bacterium]
MRTVPTTVCLGPARKKEPSATPRMSELDPRTLLNRLESLQRAGVTALPRATLRPASVDTPAEATLTPPQVEPPPEAPREPPQPSPKPLPPTQPLGRVAPQKQLIVPPATGDVSTAPSLEVLQAEVAACTACHELSTTRTQTVFGVGSPDARLCFMGEAPGADEDRLGEPFIGRAGQLLNRMLSACGLERTDVYILNVLKCRPPSNRNPAPDESQACRRFLTRQLDLIAPEYVCCLGAVAAQNFLETTTPIGRLRGRVHEHLGRKVVCTYHPAYLLRNPSAKRPAWEDLQMLMAEMGIEIPSGG